MNTLDRYILKLFVKNLAFILLALVSLYAVIEFIEKVDDFIEYQAALKYYLLFPLYNLPLMVSNTLPMAVLLSAFVTIGGLSRTNQLTALLGGGLSLTRISRPIFIAGIALSALLLACNLWLTPLGIQETEYIRNVEVSKKARTLPTQEHNIYLKNDNRIIYINRSFPQKKTLFGMIVVTYNEQFKPVQQLQAASAVYQQDGTWLLKNVKIWTLSPVEKTVTGYATHKTWPLQLQKAPDEISQLWNTPEEMTRGELEKIIAVLTADGHDARIYQLESQLRFSRAFIPLIMVLLGTPFALRRGREASFALGVIISLVIFLVYFLCYAVFAALGSSAILPLPLAAWSANILMALTGTWVFLKAQD